jgi:hypothetical protein
VLDEVTTFVKLAKDGAYMAGDRRVHHTERAKWRLTFRRLAGDALAALQADNPGSAQRAVAEIVDLACDMKSYDYFHSDDPVEAAKFVVSDAVAVLWESVLRMTASRPSPGACRSSSSAGRRTTAGLDEVTVRCRKRRQPWRSARPAAYHAGHVADVRRVLP